MPNGAHGSSTRVCCAFLTKAHRASGRPRRRQERSSAAIMFGTAIAAMVIKMAMVMSISMRVNPSDQARIARAVSDIHTLEDAITLYLIINEQYPDSLTDTGYGDLMDPWGNPYQYLNHATMKGNGQARKDRFLVPLNDDYDLYSMGKDGMSLPPITAKVSLDDIIRAGSGSYVGLASQF